MSMVNRLTLGVVMLSFSAVWGCGPRGERFTAGTLVIALRGAGTAGPVANIGLRVFDRPEEGSQNDPGTSYHSDALGRVEHHWGWLGGGGQYSVRIVVEDTTYVPVDSTATFQVQGTREDNHLDCVLKLTLRGS